MVAAVSSLQFTFIFHFKFPLYLVRTDFNYIEIQYNGQQMERFSLPGVTEQQHVAFNMRQTVKYAK